MSESAPRPVPTVLEHAAPTGFAATVASDLLSRAKKFGGEFAGQWPAWTDPRVALVTELAVLTVSKGDRDPLIAALAVAGQWKPGRRVEALIDSVLVPPQPSMEILHAEDHKRELAATAALPNAAALLHQLTSAIVRDVVEEARQIRDRAAAELIAVQPDARLEAAETRATKAELQANRAVAEAARAHKSEELLLRDVGRLRAELRYLAEQTGQDPERYLSAVLNDPEGEPPTGEDAEERELPKGVRQRGERYEALIYRSETTDSRQRSAGTYETVEEAVAARKAALEREVAPLQEAEQAAA